MFKHFCRSLRSKVARRNLPNEKSDNINGKDLKEEPKNEPEKDLSTAGGDTVNGKDLEEQPENEHGKDLTTASGETVNGKDLEEQPENEPEKDLSSASGETVIRTINYETDSNKTDKQNEEMLESVEAPVSEQIIESKTKFQDSNEVNLKPFPIAVSLKYFLPKDEEIVKKVIDPFSEAVVRNTSTMFSRKCRYQCYKRNKKCKICQCRENEIFSLNNAIRNVTVIAAHSHSVQKEDEKPMQKYKSAKKIVLPKESLKTFEKIQLKLNNMKIFYPNVYESTDNVLDQWGRNASLTDMNQELLNADELPIKALI
ncbi:unnamed protein product [Ceutorhynchus assimilis]|uniref:Uncharacterized protein n=1 Tax=Ceutorhynchus assimilis TaxID=467358 RepID=A0A9N9MED5_9CUCU|nr:unnamed protein product [Ceutorhynchus assimilis]